MCKKELAAVITALKKHSKAQYHVERISELIDPNLVRIDSVLVDHTMAKNVHDAELRMAAFLSEHDLSFNLMDHLSDLLPILCPDSKIAAHFKCKRTKMKCIVKNALAADFHNKVVEKLKHSFFSIIIDETTDVSTCKQLAIITRSYDSKTRKVKCNLYDLIELAGSSAEMLFQAICRSFVKESIPLSNIIGFAADTTNVMFGEHNSVASRLKEKVPHVYLMQCICHSAHLCASHACEKLPRTAEDLLHDVYNYFCHSAKRQSELKEFQYFTETEPHKLLRTSQTRWLSLHSCVTRLIEQWDALLHYFQMAVQRDNLLVTEKILSSMQNPIWKLYYFFLEFVLPKFTGLNLMFQSAKVSIHCLHASFVAIYKEFLSCYLKEAYWKHTPLQDIDPSSHVNLLPLTGMYMGTKVALCLPSCEYQNKAPDVQYFLKRVQEFYIEAATQIKKRFPIGDPIIKMLQVLDPNVKHSEFPSLVPLANRFPNFLPDSKMQQLDNEWRKLSIVTLPFDYEDMDPELFWERLSKITDGTENPPFGVLCEFMQTLLYLPHSNVDVERTFSDVSSIKTKKRNRLQLKTLRAIL